MTSAFTGTGAFTFGLDETSIPFLALFAVVWLLSGLYTAITTPAADRPRLFAYYVPSAVGGIGVAAASDAVSFYLCFALMALPAWGLITHTRSAESRRAGAIYLTLTVVGEALLLAALVLLVVETGTTSLPGYRDAIAGLPSAALITTLVLATIALKIGMLPLSGILSLTYTYTPAGPAAALAGASTKVGALAMLRLLPAGGMPPGWADAVMVLGLTTAFGAAVLGVLTDHPRAVLGYSSASQMGLVLIAAGAGLSDTDAATLAYGAVVAYALHHGLAKAALVLGDDVVQRLSGRRARSVALAALGLPALALVGAPLTSGFVAKYALKDAIHAVGGDISAAVYVGLSWAAVGTAALMLRFFALTLQPRETTLGNARGAALVWGLLLMLVATATWMWPSDWNQHAISSAFSLSSLWAALWPGLIALGVWGVIARVVPGGTRYRAVVEPGDLLTMVARGASRWAARADRPRPVAAGRSEARSSSLAEPLLGAERGYLRWTIAATTFVLVALALAWLALG